MTNIVGARDSRSARRPVERTLLAGLGLLLPGTTPLMAQIPAPSQVIPRDITPPAPPPTALQSPQSGVAEAPPPAGRDIVFTAGQVTIEGAIDDMARANAALLGKTSNRRVTIGDLFAAARELEQAYARAGYILVRVTIPYQRFTDGEGIRVLVTDGTIAAVNTENVPQLVRHAVMARVRPLIGARHLTLAKIERQLLLLNAIPGLKLRSALAAGKEAGTVTLVLEGTIEQVSSRLAADNRLPGSLGQWQLTASTALNNISGSGEQVYFTAGSQITQSGIATANNPLMTFGGGITLPVGTRGLTLAAEYLYSRTRPQPLPGSPAPRVYFPGSRCAPPIP